MNLFLKYSTKSFILLILLCLAIFMACSRQSSINSSALKDNQKISIITTIVPLYAFTSSIVGDRARVENLLDPGMSVHVYQSKPSDIQKIASAQVLIKNGLGLEEFLDNLITAADNQKLIVVDTSVGIETIQSQITTLGENNPVVVEKDDSVQEGVNPHIWLSPKNAILQVKNILRILQQVDSENAFYYTQNAEIYIQKLEQLDVDIHSILQSIEKKPFIVFHPAYDYFVKEYELPQIAVIEEFPGKEPSAQYLSKIITLLRDKKVSLVFTEPQFSPKLVTTLQADYGFLTAEIDPIGNFISPDAYEDMMRKNLEVMVNTFQKIRVTL